MKVMAWNIRAGGGKRTPAVADAIRLHAPELIVIGEYNPIGSKPLARHLADNGFRDPVLTVPPPRCHGLAVFSRTPVRAVALPDDLRAFASRVVLVEVPAHDLLVCGLYGLLQKEPFTEYWLAVLRLLQSVRHRAVLVAGDFNTGASLLDSPQRRFFCSQYFDRLPSAGFTDLWRRQHGDSTREFSWRGRANPYRLDHAFGSELLVGRVRACYYSHAEREQGTSDHSPMLVELRA